MKKLLFLLLLSFAVISCDLNNLFTEESPSDDSDLWPNLNAFTLSASKNTGLTSDVTAIIAKDTIFLAFPEYVRENYFTLIPDYLTTGNVSISPDPASGYIFTDDLKITLTNNNNPRYKTIYNIEAAVDPNSLIEMDLSNPFYIDGSDRVYMNDCTVTYNGDTIYIYAPSSTIGLYEGKTIGFGSISAPPTAHVSSGDMFKIAYGESVPYSFDITSGDGNWSVTYTVVVDRIESGSSSYNLYANCYPIYNWELVDAGNDYAYQYSYNHVDGGIFTDYSYTYNQHMVGQEGSNVDYDFSRAFNPRNTWYIFDNITASMRSLRTAAQNYSVIHEAGIEYGAETQLPIDSAFDNSGFSYTAPASKENFKSSFNTFNFSGTWVMFSCPAVGTDDETNYTIYRIVQSTKPFSYSLQLLANADKIYTSADHYYVTGYTLEKDNFSTFGDCIFDTSFVQEYTIDGNNLSIIFKEGVTTDTHLIGVVDLISETGTTESVILMIN